MNCCRVSLVGSSWLLLTNYWCEVVHCNARLVWLGWKQIEHLMWTRHAFITWQLHFDMGFTHPFHPYEAQCTDSYEDVWRSCMCHRGYSFWKSRSKLWSGVLYGRIQCSLAFGLYEGFIYMHRCIERFGSFTDLMSRLHLHELLKVAWLTHVICSLHVEVCSRLTWAGLVRVFVHHGRFGNIMQPCRIRHTYCNDDASTSDRCGSNRSCSGRFVNSSE